MRRVVALLATILASVAVAACGDDGAEPGASKEATLVLDFQPNAVHAGIYGALREGYYRDAGIDLEVREPSASTDAPKLLEAGRAEFAILDIHDLAIARERGVDVVGVLPIVQRPLAAVIAAHRDQVRRPRDLEGKTVGVTGLPSDDAVLDSVLEADGASPDSVHRVTIGFQAISALAAGQVDAATAFWNAEGVTLRAMGVPTREFRVDRFGAPPYPELLLCTSSDVIRAHLALVRSTLTATRRGYELAVERPAEALDDLLAEASGLDRGTQEAELDALLRAHAMGTRPPASTTVHRWIRWDVTHGILDGGTHESMRGGFKFQLRSGASAQ
jgi:NitT/TauT family transport system substrate-binding protein/putative hydroxymethylpyrimidine transport system substrate-binding protein